MCAIVMVRHTTSSVCWTVNETARNWCLLSYFVAMEINRFCCCVCMETMSTEIVFFCTDSKKNPKHVYRTSSYGSCGGIIYIVLSCRRMLFGVIQVPRNAEGGGGVIDYPTKSVTRGTVQRYWHYEGVGGCQMFRKKALRNT